MTININFIVRKFLINTVPFTLPGFAVLCTRNEKQHLAIEAKSTARTALCPNCQQSSQHPHGWYPRRPQDLPCIGQGVYLELIVRRFRCLNSECPKKTFTERFPEWLPAYARRTLRLTHVMRDVGFEVSAESGRRVLRYLRINTSGDTLLRIVKGTPICNESHPKIVGLDDWAIRKGHRYGSIIVDQETRRAVELVKGRLSEDIQPWFREHPEVEIVTRDRSNDYRNGVQVAAPQAQQVADRWHLLLNLRHLAERTAASAYRRLKKLPMSPEMQLSRPLFLRSRREQQRVDGTRQRRLDLYNEVQRLKALGLTASQMTKELPHSYHTLRFFYEALEFPERMPGRTPRSKLQPFLDYLESRFLAGEHRPTKLYPEIQMKGYTGSKGMLARWLNTRKVIASTDPETLKFLPITTTSATLPSARKLSWLLVSLPDKLNEQDILMLNHIQQDEPIRHFYELAQEFKALVLDRSVERFDAWLTNAENSTLPKVRSFAKSLHDEYSFIRAALEYEWSNGQTEGQVTRLKFIKRQMYGRASFELLRQKVLYYPEST